MTERLTKTRGRSGSIAILGAALVVSGCTTSVPSQLTPEQAQSSPTPVETTPAEAPRVSSRDAMIAWWDAGGEDRFMAILESATATAAAGDAGDLAGALESCGAFRTDIEAAQAYAPAPVREVQEPLSQALAMYARAATTCVLAAERADDAIFFQAADEIEAGTAHMDEFAEALGSALD